MGEVFVTGFFMEKPVAVFEVVRIPFLAVSVDSFELPLVEPSVGFSFPALFWIFFCLAGYLIK